jgi:hypothetical protein
LNRVGRLSALLPLSQPGYERSPRRGLGEANIRRVQLLFPVSRTISGTASGKNPTDDMPVNVGEAHIAAAEAVCEFFVIESEKLKDRGVEVKHFGDILH